MKFFFLKIIFTFLMTANLFPTSAQENKNCRLNISSDFVSSYMWRGVYMGAAAVQPTVELEAGRFTLGAWGSVSFNGREREIDLYASYTLGNFTFLLNDMWWNEDPAIKYFNYNNHETEHTFEATLSYTLPTDNFPLSIEWNTIFAGMDKKENGKQAYASYAQLSYPFQLKNVELEAVFGFTPYQAEMQYETSGFAITNIALRASREITVTKSFSIPLFTELTVNPALEDVHFVIGITLQ